MICNKKLKNFYKLHNIKLEEGKSFTKKYNKQYNKRKNIAKDHFLLSNAFDITRLIKRTRTNNKESIPESYYLEENKSKYKLNIYNYKKAYDNMLKSQMVTTNEDELLKTLLIKIDIKNVEELLKDREKLVSFQRRTLKGTSHKFEPFTYNNTTWKTFNKTNSLKSITNFHNQSKYKSKDSSNFNNSSKIILKNNNSLSLDTATIYRDNYRRNFTLPKKLKTQPMDQKMRKMFNTINSKEKMAEKNSNMLNFDISINNNNNLGNIIEEKINMKANSIKSNIVKKKDNYLKNIDKIRRKKDVEKILFRQNKFLFNSIKNRLHTLYEEGKRIPSKYLEE